MTGKSDCARSTKPSGSIVKPVVIHTRRRYSAAMTPTALWNGREPTRRFTRDIAPPPPPEHTPPEAPHSPLERRGADETLARGHRDRLPSRQRPGRRSVSG